MDDFKKEIFFNRADVKKAERLHCDNCFDQVVFHLRDSSDREFSLGLSNVLECLVFAIQTGSLPKLPLSWLADADAVCETFYAEDERNFYSDYNFPRKRE